MACTEGAYPNATGAVLLVSRGTCNFVAKVRRAQQAGAAAAIVIPRKHEQGGDAVPMPAGNLDTADLTIPAAMVSAEHGKQLLSLAPIGLRARLASAGRCDLASAGAGGDAEEEVVEEELDPRTGRPKRKIEVEGHGRLYAVDLAAASRQRVMELRQATYGGALPRAAVRIVAALPKGKPESPTVSTACSPGAVEPAPGNANGFKGTWLLTARGGCPFTAKAMTAQEVGALGCVVMNTKPAQRLMAMPGAPDQAKAVRIPSVMVSAEDGAWILGETRKDGGTGELLSKMKRVKKYDFF